jgi:hypothetical protein
MFNKRDIATNIKLKSVFVLCSLSPADVDFWINGGWNQPNCGITVNLLFFLQFSKIKDLNGKNCNSRSISASIVLLKVLKRFLNKNKL